MHSYERRLLAEIESRLALDDPEWARKFSGAAPTRPAARLRLVLGVFAALLAVGCVLLGEAGGFLLAAATAAALFASRTWRLWSA